MVLHATGSRRILLYPFHRWRSAARGGLPNPVDMLKSVSPKGDQIKQMILAALYFGFTGLLLRKVHPRAMLFVGVPLIC